MDSISVTTDINKPRYPSLYQQYCCYDDNRGKNFIITTTEVNKYILCPQQIPDSCSADNIFTSCTDVLRSNSSAVSGNYNITLANGTIVNVFCALEPFGCEGEGWRRIGYLNMTDPSQDCPSGFDFFLNSNIRYCAKPPKALRSCQSIQFPSNGISYTEVCGRATGYQIGLILAILPDAANIDDVYVDGVSITRGSPRKHIWTFIGNTFDISTSNISQCPCAVAVNGRTFFSLPSFVGEEYYCESGGTEEEIVSITYLASNDLLWDGKQCGILEEGCCDVPGIPWFNRVLDEPTTDDIELRLCSQISFGSPVLTFYDIYVK